MDTMFQRLRTTHDPAEARMLEVAIRHAWAWSGQSRVDVLMRRAATDIRAGDFDEALGALDKVVDLAPDYPEGWNLRATVYFLQDDYARALADLERVLAIEPRHFGALAGLGHVFLALDDKEAALRAFRAALAINPYLDEVRAAAQAIEEEVAGIPI